MITFDLKLHVPAPVACFACRSGLRLGARLLHDLLLLQRHHRLVPLLLLRVHVVHAALDDVRQLVEHPGLPQ